MKSIVRCLLACCLLFWMTNCSSSDNQQVPVIGFVDAFEDSTIKQAKNGFLAALQEKGFSENDGTLQVLYRNAQGNIPTLTQIIQYFLSRKVTLIASNTSLSTITAIQNTKDIPVFMMVSPTPALMKVTNAQGRAPGNLFGVAEDLKYIDTSFALIPSCLPAKSKPLTVGLIYNQSEPQSVDAFNRLSQLANDLNIKLIALPVNATADVPLVTSSLLARQPDAFFANPDNTIFASFETIVDACNKAGIPIFTSEAGLVARGAVAAFGADLYQWGYQAGAQAAQFLKTGSLEGLQWEMVQIRRRVYNAEAAQSFGITIPADFEAIQ